MRPAVWSGLTRQRWQPLSATLIEDRETRDRLGVNARRFVEDHFSHDRFAACLADAWEEVWGDRPET